MTVLLDTQLLIWSQITPQRLPLWLVEQLERPDYAPYFSVVSIWEIVIKASLKKLHFDYDPLKIRTTLLEKGWRELVLTSEHVLGVSKMLPLHGDPFDRVLLAQAQVEKRTFVTTDRALGPYGDWVKVVKSRNSV